MSVLARNRSLSKLEFYTTAIELRKKVTKNLLINFHVKMKKDEAMDEFSAWLILKLRNSMYDILHDLVLNITRAYTIWATNLSEANERRNAQNRAIADCESILKELEYAYEVLPVNAERYMADVEMVEKEIALIKGWRKSDNKRFKSLMCKGNS